MALIVEDGSALNNAESYVSVVDADTYHFARGRELAWNDQDQDVKEGALRVATDYMVQVYRVMWLGYRFSDKQALDWPRYDVPKIDSAFGLDAQGRYFAYYTPHEVPVEVKNACCELALRALNGDLNPDLPPPALSKSIGPISVTYEAGARQKTKFQMVDDMLAPLLKRGGKGFTIVRA